jgi:hypothetical protein
MDWKFRRLYRHNGKSPVPGQLYSAVETGQRQ